MKNKIFFRIIGALASALMIVAVFVPFINVVGYSQSIWGLYSKGSIYLPIMIIVFGAIGVIFFSLNIKTEFAYMSVGAISFYLIMRTVDIISQGTFNTLNAGYYFLLIGTIVTGIMAFLSNLKSKDVIEEKKQPIVEEEKSLLTKIDNLYDNPQSPMEVNIQPLDVNIQPLPIQEVNIPVENNQMSQPIPDVSLPIPEPVVPTVNEVSSPIINPVIQEFSQSIERVQPINQPVSPIVEQPVQFFNAENQVEPVTQINEQVQVSNPVVQQFETQPSIMPLNTPAPQPTEPTQNLQNNQGVDIFGQPVNR